MKEDVISNHFDDSKELKYKKRIEEMRKEKRKQEILRKIVFPITCVAILIVIFIITHVFRGIKAKEETALPYSEVTQENNIEEGIVFEETHENIIETEEINEEINSKQEFNPIKDNYTQNFTEDIVSAYGILIDVDNQKVLAQREGYTKMYPASMTKILTVLVAAEQIEEEQLKDTFMITREITDYCFVNDCSCVGFDVEEIVTIEDLFYGTILPSGADAALGLAYYISGSQESFVELMNEKLKELGISDTTHFTNCVGIYDDNHYSTAYDMAIIMNAAYENEFCRKVLSEHTYTTSANAVHPDGITMSNWFLRRIEDKDTHAEVLCGKTGYVRKSGNCSTSLAIDKNGRRYICVTAMSSSVKNCLLDQTSLYAKYIEG